jgi:coproporphyrinogen III oxidase-like Fe-S oxidoreductase
MHRVSIGYQSMEDKMEQNIEILNFEEIVKQYNLTASEVL